jgi:hypothetical protein
MRVREEDITAEAKNRIKKLNNNLPANKHVKGIVGLFQLHVGTKDASKILYYAVERNVLPETKKLIIYLIEQAAKSMKLAAHPLFI